MAISKKSTGEQLSLWTLSAEATPANLSAPQEKDAAKKTRAISGRGYDLPLAHYDPATRSWKMYGDISLWEEQPSLESLPKSGITQSGELYLQPDLEPPIDATESLSWPTPTAVTRPMEGDVRLFRKKIEAGEMTEEEAEAILGKSVWEAQGKIPAMWPLPQVDDSKNVNPSPKRRKTLVSEVMKREMWPTPTYGKLAGGTGAMEQIEAKYLAGEITSEERRAMRAGNGGKLNPTWVEWLMGFPLEWTDLKDSETQ